jgi:hypothetical protein
MNHRRVVPLAVAACLPGLILLALAHRSSGSDLAQAVVREQRNHGGVRNEQGVATPQGETAAIADAAAGWAILVASAPRPAGGGQRGRRPITPQRPTPQPLQPGTPGTAGGFYPPYYPLYPVYPYPPVGYPSTIAIPFHRQLQIVIPAGQVNGAQSVTLPYHRAVIEHVTGSVEVPLEQRVRASLVTAVDGATVRHTLPLGAASLWQGASLFEFSVPAHLYADAGSAIGISVLRSSGDGQAMANFTISGSSIGLAPSVTWPMTPVYPPLPLTPGTPAVPPGALPR